MDFNAKTLKKSLGQNFITDINLLKAIIQDAQITPDDNVLEIGTGAGALTKVLSEYANKVLSYEIDKSLRPVISRALSDAQNTQVVFEDFLEAKEKDIIKFIGKNYKVVANLPYYITTPIIFKLLDFAALPASITIMAQLEVGQRIVAKPASKDYGALTVGIESKYQAKIARKVKKEMFIPRPKVDSCVIHLVYRPYKIDDYDFFKRTVKSAFCARRKQLVNNLSADFDVSKDVLKDILRSINIDPSVRGEMLNTHQFIDLSAILKKHIQDK
ncbi:MAG TPA: ribosomal RNA small subunit methyltransferase A [Clostridiales bacterium]|nr:ribosomal RNA small subunit methyltransferase A [Clostridiales bacterium]